MVTRIIGFDGRSIVTLIINVSLNSYGPMERCVLYLGHDLATSFSKQFRNGGTMHRLTIRYL